MAARDLCDKTEAVTMEDKDSADTIVGNMDCSIFWAERNPVR